MSLSIRPDAMMLRDLSFKLFRQVEAEVATPATRDPDQDAGASDNKATQAAPEPDRETSASGSGLLAGAGMLFPPPFFRELPGQIDGGGEGAGWNSGQTTDGKRLDSAVLAISIDAGTVISREVTWRSTGSGDRVGLDQVVVQTGRADDEVHVSQRDDGSLDVVINGHATNIMLENNQELAIRTGDGDDRVTVESGVTVNIDADLGAGDDVILAHGSGNDRIKGGDGNDTISVTGGGPNGGDYVDGGRGDDVIIAVGGSNTIYGGRGDDVISVTGDNNHVDAGRGDDQVTVTGDTNVIGGGRGNDTITSDGDNTIYTGRGRDDIRVNGGDATVYGQFGVYDIWHGDTVTVADGASADRQQVDLSPDMPFFSPSHPVNVDGSREFADRVESDLDFLEASPAGQQMFEEFRQARENGHEVTIAELQNERNGFASPQGDRGFIGEDSEGKGVDVRIGYNAEHFKYGDEFHSPLVTLYHEMSHAYNGVTGTYQPGEFEGPGDEPHVDDGVNNRERQAVGLETSNDPYDYDGDPSTPPTTHNPYPLTENGLREEMGVPLRESYR